MIDGTFDVVGAAGPRALFEHLSAATISHGYLFLGRPVSEEDVRAGARALAVVRDAQAHAARMVRALFGVSRT